MCDSLHTVPPPYIGRAKFWAKTEGGGGGDARFFLPLPPTLTDGEKYLLESSYSLFLLVLQLAL